MPPTTKRVFKPKPYHEAKYEGKLGFITGRQCPYTTPRLKKAWMEGYAKEKRKSQQANLDSQS